MEAGFWPTVLKYKKKGDNVLLEMVEVGQSECVQVICDITMKYLLVKREKGQLTKPTGLFA